MEKEEILSRVKFFNDNKIIYSVYMDNGMIYNNDNASVIFWNWEENNFDFIRLNSSNNLAINPIEYGTAHFDHVEDVRSRGGLDTAIKFIEAVNPDQKGNLKAVRDMFIKQHLESTITGSTGDGVGTNWDGAVKDRYKNNEVYFDGSTIGGMKKVLNQFYDENPDLDPRKEAEKEFIKRQDELEQERRNEEQERINNKEASEAAGKAIQEYYKKRKEALIAAEERRKLLEEKKKAEEEERKRQEEELKKQEEDANGNLDDPGSGSTSAVPDSGVSGRDVESTDPEKDANPGHSDDADPHESSSVQDSVKENSDDEGTTSSTDNNGDTDNSAGSEDNKGTSSEDTSQDSQSNGSAMANDAHSDVEEETDAVENVEGAADGPNEVGASSDTDSDSSDDAVPQLDEEGADDHGELEGTDSGSDSTSDDSNPDGVSSQVDETEESSKQADSSDPVDAGED